MIQLDLFQEPKEKEVDNRLTSVEEKCDKLRKSLHCRLSMQQKKIKELELELEFLKSHICKGNLFV